MELFLGVFLLIFIIFIPANAVDYTQMSRRRCWSSGNGLSPQWWPEGARVDRGRYWYECKNGELYPKGCFTEKKQRIALYETFVQNEYEIQCVRNDEGYLEFKFSACMSSDGQRYTMGESWEEPRHMYWYTCNPDGPYLRADVSGCVSHDKTRRIRLGDEYEFDGYVYRCEKKYNGSIQMCSVGCVDKGRRYKIGEQWPDGDYVYYCKLNGGRCQKMCVGCQYNDQRLYDGDRYQKGGTVFQCEVRPDKYGHMPVACIVTDQNGETVQRVVGCTWYLETKNTKVEQTCVLENNRTVVKTTGCIFVYKGYDTLFLHPGTYTIWNQMLDGTPVGVACRETSGYGEPEVEVFKVDDLFVKTVGLNYDQPRGK